MKYLLSVLCLILIGIIFYQYKYYSNSDLKVNANFTANVDEASIPAANKTLKSIRAYSEIIERPLFSTDRKPPAVISGNNAASIDTSDLEDLILYGVVISNENRYAVVGGASDNAQQMRVGYVYKGWNVSEINADSIKFESSKGQYELFISPNDSDKKSSIRKTIQSKPSKNTPSKKNTSVTDDSGKPAERRSIFRKSYKPVKSPIVIPKTESKVELTKEELDLLDELGGEGEFRDDLDEDQDEENLDDEGEFE